MTRNINDKNGFQHRQQKSITGELSEQLRENTTVELCVKRVNVWAIISAPII